MKSCPACGRANGDHFKYCVACGALLETLGRPDNVQERPGPPPIRRVPGHCDRCGKELTVNEKLRGATIHVRCPDVGTQKADPGVRVAPSPQGTLRWGWTDWLLAVAVVGNILMMAGVLWDPNASADEEYLFSCHLRLLWTTKVAVSFMALSGIGLAAAMTVNRWFAVVTTFSAGVVLYWTMEGAGFTAGCTKHYVPQLVLVGSLMVVAASVATLIAPVLQSRASQGPPD